MEAYIEAGEEGEQLGGLMHYRVFDNIGYIIRLMGTA